MIIYYKQGQANSRSEYKEKGMGRDREFWAD